MFLNTNCSKPLHIPGDSQRLTFHWGMLRWRCCKVFYEEIFLKWLSPICIMIDFFLLPLVSPQFSHPKKCCNLFSIFEYYQSFLSLIKDIWLKMSMLCCIGIAYPLLKCDRYFKCLSLFALMMLLYKQIQILLLLLSLNFCVWRHIFSEFVFLIVNPYLHFFPQKWH